MNHSLLDCIINSVNGTPVWVWVVFAYLVFLGLKATYDRVVYIPKLFIIPTILIGLQYKIYLSGNYFSLIIYLIFLMVGIGIGILSAATIATKVYKETKTMEISGNYSTLLILLSLLFTQYIFGYLHATNPIVANQFASLEISINAIFSGYFLGRATRWALLLI